MTRLRVIFFFVFVLNNLKKHLNQLNVLIFIKTIILRLFYDYFDNFMYFFS